jgi:hypothetical protein
MSERRLSNQRRLLEDLLVRRATEPLDATATTSIASLQPEFPEVDVESFDRAAAAIWLAAAAPRQPMPAALRDRILSSATGPERDPD